MTDPEFDAHVARQAADVSRRVGARVRVLSTERGLSTADLSNQAGIARNTLERIEADQAALDLDLQERLLAALGQSARALVDDDPVGTA